VLVSGHKLRPTKACCPLLGGYRHPEDLPPWSRGQPRDQRHYTDHMRPKPPFPQPQYVVKKRIITSQRRTDSRSLALVLFIEAPISPPSSGAGLLQMTHSLNATSCLININNAVRATYFGCLARGSLPFRLSIFSPLAAPATPISAKFLLACALSFVSSDEIFPH
jgi:hypothetical protein